jgi:hypothetical protein
MTETTTAKKPIRQSSISISLVEDLEFIFISDTLKEGQWAEWEVGFTIKGERFSGRLQACPHHPQAFHHDIIEDYEHFENASWRI